MCASFREGWLWEKRLACVRYTFSTGPSVRCAASGSLFIAEDPLDKSRSLRPVVGSEGLRICVLFTGFEPAFQSELVVAPAGVEPAAFGLGNQRSVQLSYGTLTVSKSGARERS